MGLEKSTASTKKEGSYSERGWFAAHQRAIAFLGVLSATLTWTVGEVAESTIGRSEETVAVSAACIKESTGESVPYEKREEGDGSSERKDSVVLTCPTGSSLGVDRVTATITQKDGEKVAEPIPGSTEILLSNIINKEGNDLEEGNNLAWRVVTDEAGDRVVVEVDPRVHIEGVHGTQN